MNDIINRKQLAEAKVGQLPNKVNRISADKHPSTLAHMAFLYSSVTFGVKQTYSLNFNPQGLALIIKCNQSIIPWWKEKPDVNVTQTSMHPDCKHNFTV